MSFYALPPSYNESQLSVARSRIRLALSNSNISEDNHRPWSRRSKSRSNLQNGHGSSPSGSSSYAPSTTSLSNVSYADSAPTPASTTSSPSTRWRSNTNDSTISSSSKPKRSWIKRILTGDSEDKGRDAGRTEWNAVWKNVSLGFDVPNGRQSFTPPAYC